MRNQNLLKGSPGWV